MGESIIIPMAMSTLATTRSMIRNGMKITKPIWKAVLSSLVMNAATSTGSGTPAAVSGAGSPRMSRKSLMSCSRVWASMKPLSGSTPA